MILINTIAGFLCRATDEDLLPYSKFLPDLLNGAYYLESSYNLYYTCPFFVLQLII